MKRKWIIEGRDILGIYENFCSVLLKETPPTCFSKKHLKYFFKFSKVFFQNFTYFLSLKCF